MRQLKGKYLLFFNISLLHTVKCAKEVPWHTLYLEVLQRAYFDAKVNPLSEADRRTPRAWPLYSWPSRRSLGFLLSDNLRRASPGKVPISSARRENGELCARVLNFIFSPEARHAAPPPPRQAGSLLSFEGGGARCTARIRPTTLAVTKSERTSSTRSVRTYTCRPHEIPFSASRAIRSIANTRYLIIELLSWNRISCIWHPPMCFQRTSEKSYGTLKRVSFPTLEISASNSARWCI